MLVISHRLVNVKNADQIVGRVVGVALIQEVAHLKQKMVSTSGDAGPNRLENYVRKVEA